MEDRQEEPLPGPVWEPLCLLLMWPLWWAVVRVAWSVDTGAWSVGHGISKAEGPALESQLESTSEELQAQHTGSPHTGLALSRSRSASQTEEGSCYVIQSRTVPLSSSFPKGPAATRPVPWLWERV